MKISTEKPPIYDRLEDVFGKGLWDQGVLITYGDTVHCKSGGMSQDLRVHEQLHIDRQAVYPGGKDAWWDRYLTDPKFRFEEELASYQAQAEYIRKNVPNRRKQFEKLDWIRRCISEKYDGIVTYAEACELI